METNEKQEEAPKQEAKEATEVQGKAEGDTDKGEPVQEKTPEATGEPSPIERGDAILKGIAEAEERFAKLVERQEKAVARMLLGGKATVGEPVKTPEEEQKEKTETEVKQALDMFE